MWSSIPPPNISTGRGGVWAAIVLSDHDFIHETMWDYFRHTGPSLSPFNAWVLLKGLETLPLRVAQQTATAGRLADLLAASDGVVDVRYPGRADFPQADLAARQMTGGSTLVAFTFEGDAATAKARAFAFENALEIVAISNNLGDAKSLVTHPATTTHKNLSEADRDALGIGPGLVRLSVGLEDADDLAADVEAALVAAARV